MGNKTDRPSDIKKRINILEMLLWKNHIDGIPKDVFERLKENYFLIKVGDGYSWSEQAIILSKKFDKTFLNDLQIN